MPVASGSRLVNARRDALVLAILIIAVSLLIWNGSTFFYDLRIAGTALRPGSARLRAPR